MEPKIKTRLTNLIARLAGSPDYDPRIKPKFPIEFYLEKYIKQPVAVFNIPLVDFTPGPARVLDIDKATFEKAYSMGYAQINIARASDRPYYIPMLFKRERGKLQGIYIDFHSVNVTEDYELYSATITHTPGKDIFLFQGNYYVKD